MAAMVSSDVRTRRTVRQYVRARSAAEHPITSPARMAATRMPVPVADAHDSAKTALSVTGADTTGGTRSTRLCSPGTGSRTVVHASSVFLMYGSPHANTRTLRMIHGI